MEKMGPVELCKRRKGEKGGCGEEQCGRRRMKNVWRLCGRRTERGRR